MDIKPFVFYTRDDASHTYGYTLYYFTRVEGNRYDYFLLARSMDKGKCVSEVFSYQNVRLVDGENEDLEEYSDAGSRSERRYNLLCVLLSVFGDTNLRVLQWA
jgi:hypothetical protein